MQEPPSRRDVAAVEAEVVEAVTVAAGMVAGLTSAEAADTLAADISLAPAVAASVAAAPALPAADDITAEGRPSHMHRADGRRRSRVPPAAAVFAAIAPPRPMAT